MIKCKRLKNKQKQVFQILDESNLMGQNEIESSFVSQVDPVNLINHGDFYSQVRPIFILGKFLGIVPFSGVFSKTYLHVTFTPFSASSMINVAVIFLLTINLVLESIQAVQVSKRNAVEIAVAVKAPIFYGYGLFIYCYFLLRARKIISLFHAWVNAGTVYSAPDQNLRKYVKLICCAIMTSAILENGILHLKYFQQFDTLNDVVMDGYNEKSWVEDTNSSMMEIYYRRTHYDWSNVLGYNLAYAVLVFIANKWTLYSWNFVDLFLCICGRAIYFRFKCLCNISREKLLLLRPSQNGNHGEAYYDEQKQWLQLVKDHETLCNLLKEFEAVLSPLIFLSYMVNVFYTCMQIYMSLNFEDSGPQSVIHSIYTPWSLLHLGARVYLVSISLARVHVFAHKIMNVIIDCPSECYDRNISRLDRRVTRGRNIGFTGLGCFTVTKAYILHIVGVIFTFEIVLLGSSPSKSSGGGKCCCKAEF